MYQELQGVHTAAAASLVRLEREAQLKKIEANSLRRLLDSMEEETAANSSATGEQSLKCEIHVKYSRKLQQINMLDAYNDFVQAGLLLDIAGRLIEAFLHKKHTAFQMWCLRKRVLIRLTTSNSKPYVRSSQNRISAWRRTPHRQQVRPVS